DALIEQHQQHMRLAVAAAPLPLAGIVLAEIAQAPRAAWIVGQADGEVRRELLQHGGVEAQLAEAGRGERDLQRARQLLSAADLVEARHVGGLLAAPNARLAALRDTQEAVTA